MTVLVGSLVVLGACGGTAPSAGTGTGTAAQRDIDPGGRLGQGMAFDFGSLWIALGDKGVVARVDPATGKIANELMVSDPSRVPARAHVDHAAPNAVVSAFGSIWAIGADGVLARIDPLTNAITTFDVGIVGGYLCAGEGALWITSYDDGALVRFDPAAGVVTMTLHDLGGLHGVAVGFGSVWAVNKSGHEVLRIDPDNGMVKRRIPTARNPDFVTVGAGSVWVTRESPRAVLRIDPSSDAVTATIPADAGWGSGVGIAFYDGAIWTGFLVRIDPATEKLSASFTSRGGDQGGLVFGAGSAWVADFGELHQIPLALVR